MRVLHVLSTPSAGGAEIYVRDLAKALNEKGHYAAIAFVGHAADVGNPPEFESKFLEHLQTHRIDYFFIGNECRRNLLKGRRRVRRLISELGIEIYHSHLFYGGLFAAFLDLPRLYTHHNSIAKAPRPFFSVFNRCVDQYIGISEECSRRLAEYTSRPVETIFNGADAAKFSVCKPYPVDQEGSEGLFRFIAVGALHPQKDYVNLLNAVAAIPDSLRKKIRLSICGTGRQRSELEDLIRTRDLQPVVELLGNRSDVPQLLQASHAFVMSSAWEGLSIALLEALLTGLPCVVTDVGGNSEVIRNCRNGITVPAGDHRALAEAMSKLVLDPQLHATYRENAAQLGGLYSIDKAAAAHVRLYESWLSRLPLRRKRQ